MRLAGRRGAVIVALLLWVLAGPLAAAFGPCAAMGMMCEAPCGAGAPPASVSEGLSSLPAVAAVVGSLPGELPTTTQKVPEPPPKQLLFTA
jgi:hypothetical protein